MPKLQTFYGVWTTDDEINGSFKAYAQTRELAEEELKNHHDFYCSTSPIPDNKHIVPLNMIVADNSNEAVNTQENTERNVPNESLYATAPMFRSAVDGLERSIKDYLEYYNNLSPEKKSSEIYFWQEFVSSLD